MCRQRLGKLKALVGPMLERAAEATERPRALDTARAFLELVGKSANAWEAIKPWVNHTQRLDLLAQVLVQPKIAVSEARMGQIARLHAKRAARVGGHQALGKQQPAPGPACPGILCPAWCCVSKQLSAKASLIVFGMATAPTHACPWFGTHSVWTCMLGFQAVSRLVMRVQSAGSHKCSAVQGKTSFRLSARITVSAPSMRAGPGKSAVRKLKAEPCADAAQRD